MLHSHKIFSLCIGLVVCTGALVGFLSFGLPGNHHPAHAQSAACGTPTISLQRNGSTTVIDVVYNGIPSGFTVDSASGIWDDSTAKTSGTWSFGGAGIQTSTFFNVGGTYNPNFGDGVASSGNIGWATTNTNTGAIHCWGSVQVSLYV